MLNSKTGRTLLITLGLCIFASLVAVGCGDTSGDPEEAGLGTQYVADGGAGGSISISVKGSLTVGNTVGFTVTLRDPRGEPLAFVRVNCDTEKGIAIIEPSEGGVAFEHTDSGGLMSGLLGGLAEGSYILECRAPVEYNLISRVSIVIRGSSPENFTGWPGAAGGNLGGGRIVDPDVDTGGVRITEISYQDLGTDALYIDNDFISDCDPDEDGAQPEPFTVNTYTLNLSNETFETVFIDTVTILVGDGRGITMTQPIDLEIAPRSTASYTGQLTDGNPKFYAGTAFLVIDGTFPITFTVDGEAADSGDGFSVTESQTVTFTALNNCEE